MDYVMHSVCVPRYHLFFYMFADEDETVTGCIRPETLDRIRPDDAGGQYDSSGGTNGEGNPAGSVCRGYVVIFCSEGSF